MKANKLNLYPYEATDEFGRLILPVKFGYAERPGDPFIIEPRFDMAYEFSDNIATGYGPLAKVEVDGKTGIIYPDGTYLIKPQFYRIGDFHNGFAVVIIKHEFYNDYGVIKLDGSYLVSPKYDYIYDFKDGYAKAELNGKTGYINTNGDWLNNKPE